MNSSRFAEAAAAHVRAGALLVVREYPPTVFAVSLLIPEILRVLLYVLIAALASGTAGMRYALVGAGLLSIVTVTVGQVTDLPIYDALQQTYSLLAQGRLPVFIAYLVRSASLAVEAIIIAFCTMVVLSLVTGQMDLIGPLLAHFWLVLPAIFSALAFGLALVAPSITSPWSVLTYNTAASVVVVFCGAVIAVPNLAGIVVASKLIPLTHAVQAMRLALAGQPYGHAVLLELAVGAGWWVVAACAYAAVEHHGRATGRGAFGA